MGCGCRVVIETRQILYCPLHAQAPAMAALLREIVDAETLGGHIDKAGVVQAARAIPRAIEEGVDERQVSTDH